MFFLQLRADIESRGRSQLLALQNNIPLQRIQLCPEFFADRRHLKRDNLPNLFVGKVFRVDPDQRIEIRLRVHSLAKPSLEFGQTRFGHRTLFAQPLDSGRDGLFANLRKTLNHALDQQ